MRPPLGDRCVATSTQRSLPLKRSLIIRALTTMQTWRDVSTSSRSSTQRRTATKTPLRPNAGQSPLRSNPNLIRTPTSPSTSSNRGVAAKATSSSMSCTTQHLRRLALKQPPHWLSRDRSERVIALGANGIDAAFRTGDSGQIITQLVDYAVGFLDPLSQPRDNDLLAASTTRPTLDSTQTVVIIPPSSF